MALSEPEGSCQGHSLKSFYPAVDPAERMQALISRPSVAAASVELSRAICAATPSVAPGVPEAMGRRARTTATTRINGGIVFGVLENILTGNKDVRLDDGACDEVFGGRVAFQTETEDEFTAAIESIVAWSRS
jgi:hypothetical protein